MYTRSLLKVKGKIATLTRADCNLVMTRQKKLVTYKVVRMGMSLRFEWKSEGNRRKTPASEDQTFRFCRVKDVSHSGCYVRMGVTEEIKNKDAIIIPGIAVV